MRKPSIRTAAIASVGMILMVGSPAASATSGGSHATAHASVNAGGMTMTHHVRAISGRSTQAASLPSGAAEVVAVNCHGQGQASPIRLALRCARGNLPPGNYVTGLRWQQWGSRGPAFGTGTEHPATCVGSTSVAVVLWGLRPWPSHAGQRYFTRMTVINMSAPTAWSPRTTTVHLES